MAVVHLVLGDNGEGSLEFLIVDELLGSANAESGRAFGGVVEVGDGEGVMGELFSVELDEVSVVSLGEGPDYAVGSLHLKME